MLVWQRLSQMVSDSGIPQAEIARRIGEHRNWVNNRVNGAVDLRADELPRFAAALGVHKTTVRRWAAEGKLRSIKPPNGRYRFFIESTEVV